MRKFEKWMTLICIIIHFTPFLVICNFLESASTSVSTFSLSTLTHLKSGKRKKSEIVSSVLASSLPARISTRSQFSNTLDKYKTGCNTSSDHYQGCTNNDIENNNNTNSALQPETYVEEIAETNKNSILGDGSRDNNQYSGNALPLIIGDTVHIVEENGEGK